MKKDTRCYIQMGVIIGGTIGLGVLTAGLGPAILGPTIIKKIAELAINMAPELLGELLDDRLDESAFEKLNEEFKKSFNKEISLQKNDFRNIFKEVGEKIKPNFWGNIWEKPAVFFTKKENKERRKDNQAIQRASSHVTKYINDYLFSIKIEEIFYESKTYQGLNSNDKEVFKKLLENLREESLYEEFQKLETEDQITISIIEVLIKKSNWEIKEELKEIKEIITTYLSQVRVNGGSIEQIQSNVQSLKLLSHECPNCGYYGQHLYFNESNTKVYCAACGKEYSILKDLADSEEIKNKLDYIQEIIQTNNTNVQGEIKLLAETLLEKAYFEECLNNQTATIESAFANQRAYFEEIKQKIEETNNVEKICQRVSNEAVVATRKLESLSEQVVSLYNLAVEKFENLTIGQEELLVFIKNSVTQEFLRSEIGAIGQDLKEYQNQNLEKQLAAMQGISDAGIAKILVAISDLSNKVRGDSEEKIKETINRESQKAIYEIQGLKELLDSRTHEIVAYLKMLEKKLEVELIATGNKSVRLSYNGLVPEEYLLNNGFSNKPFACPFCGKIEARELSHEQKCHCSTCGNTYWALDIFDGNAKTFAAEHGRKEEINSLVKRVKEWRNYYKAKIIFENGEYRIRLDPNTESYEPLKFLYFDNASTFDTRVTRVADPGSVDWFHEDPNNDKLKHIIAEDINCLNKTLQIGETRKQVYFVNKVEEL